MFARTGSPPQPAGTTEQKEYTGAGGMVAWYPPRALAERLALGGSGAERPEELHLTLCFFPDWAALDVAAVAGAMERVSVAFPPLAGAVSGVGRFSIPDGDALVALADVPHLSLLREALVWELREQGVAYADDHGFTAHITLTYLKPGARRVPLERLEPAALTISSLTLKGPDGPVGEIALSGAKQRQEPTALAKARDADEEKLLRTVTRVLSKIERAVWRRLQSEAKALGDIVDDDAFWREQQLVFQSTFTPGEAAGVLGRGAQQAVQLGLPVDFNLVNQQALDLAGVYTDDWWAALSSSTRDGLRTAVQQHIQTGEPLSALRKRIEPMFGRARAQRIATTETTRMYAEGSRLSYANSGGIVSVVEWRTANDERVDPLCEALFGQRWPEGEEEFVPPRHVSCRCWLAPVVCLPTGGSKVFREKQSECSPLGLSEDSWPEKWRGGLGEFDTVGELEAALKADPDGVFSTALESYVGGGAFSSGFSEAQMYDIARRHLTRVWDTASNFFRTKIRLFSVDAVNVVSKLSDIGKARAQLLANGTISSDYKIRLWHVSAQSDLEHWGRFRSFTYSRSSANRLKRELMARGASVTTYEVEVPLDWVASVPNYAHSLNIADFAYQKEVLLHHEVSLREIVRKF